MGIWRQLLATALLAGITTLVGEASEGGQDAVEGRQTEIPEAQHEYLLGRQKMAERSVEAVRRAKLHFERAVELDPEYAQAFVGLADALGVLASLEWTDPGDSLEARRAAIDRALAIDPDLGEAYASLGLLKQHQGSMEEAEQDFLKSIELSPDYATAYKWYANLLSCQKDRKEDSIPIYRKALELEPASPIIQENLARILMFTGRADEAQSVALAGIEQNPNSAVLHSVMADIYRFSEHRFDQALRWSHAAAVLDPLTPSHRLIECETLLQLGMDQAAETCLESLEASFPNLDKSTTVRAKRDLYLMRGVPEEAVEYVEDLARAQPSESFRWLLGETYVLNGDFSKARPIYEQLRPEFFADQDAPFPKYKVGSAIFVGQILYAGGEQEAANHLFDQALRLMSAMDRSLYGFLDANIYMTRGDGNAAIDALREGYELKLFDGWWYLEAPVYDPMRDDPEWTEVVGQFLAEIERQREHYRETQDNPLM